MNKMAVVRITLQSDLCVGSGYSYAGVIDSDVTSDRYGIPYIPARRLKGCMREAAEMISAILQPDAISKLFGKRGQKMPGKLCIENARIKNYASIISAIERSGFSKEYSRERILQQFSSVRAQTKMDETGIAMDNTLRFIRVVNQMSPLVKTNQPEDLAFYAEVIYPEKYENDLAMIAKATRSIGLNRNRGLGNICCELDVSNAKVLSTAKFSVCNKSVPVEICYTLLNEAPLMISQDSDNVSETYIPGRRILGALAANYLSIKGNSAEDAAFRDLFLNGETTQFLNAYIADIHGERCIPVPGYVNRLKKSRKLVNFERIYEAEESGDYSITGGNQPKKLSGKYCTISQDKDHAVCIQETERQLTYHHRHKHGDEDVQLYSHLEITEGQHFAGVIRTSAAYLELMVSLLEQGFRLGKSRSAEYGKCTICDITSREAVKKSLDVRAGDDVLVSLSAPAVFTRNGQETVSYEQIYNLLARDLGIEGKIGPARRDPDGRNPLGIIDSKMIYGYQSIWNLRRTPVAAISEGSVLVYHMEQDAQINCCTMVGSMRLEGYGEIHVEKMSDIPYHIKEYTSVPDGLTHQDVPQELQTLAERIERKQRLDDKLNFIRESRIQRILQPISASAIGRITLMLREASGYSQVPEKQYENYKKRIESIKTDSVRKQAMKYAQICNPKDLGEFADQWSAIALEGLTFQKYLKKQEAQA